MLEDIENKVQINGYYPSAISNFIAIIVSFALIFATYTGNIEDKRIIKSLVTENMELTACFSVIKDTVSKLALM